MAQNIELMMAAFPGRWAAGSLLSDANPQLIRILSLWRAAAGEQAFPHPAALGPAELKPVLPNVHIYTLSPEAPRYRIRLIGTRMTDYIGRNLAGKSVDEVSAVALRRALNGLISAVESAGTWLHLMAPRALALPNDDHKSLESLWLPCAADGQTIDRIIAVSLLGSALD